MKKISKFIVIGLLTTSLIASLWISLNTQTVLDWWALRNYDPTPQIQKLANDSSFSELGRKLFYITDPKLLDKQNFQGKCNIGEETIVLGCFISPNRIYIFDVQDERLEGVEEVTAAHEMLHVVYDRMSGSDREKIDRLVTDYYIKLNDPRLNETIDSYRQRDPNIVANELHSILGTEYSDLPVELEEHYKKYFVDRLVVVSKSKEYAQEFDKLEFQIKQYDSQLAGLNNSIQELENNLSLQNSALENEYRELQSLRSDTESYNQAVPVYNQSVAQFNRQLEELNSLVERYNRLVKERNAIAIEERELVEAIDTRLTELE